MLTSLLMLTSAFVEGAFNNFKYTIEMNNYGEWGIELFLMITAIPGCFIMFAKLLRNTQRGIQE